MTNKQTGNNGNGRGRPPGSRNKHTLEIEAKAKLYAGDALKALVDIATDGESESARVAAACALLDRGYGRAKQTVEMTTDQLATLPDEELAEIAGKSNLRIA